MRKLVRRGGGVDAAVRIGCDCSWAKKLYMDERAGKRRRQAVVDQTGVSAEGCSFIAVCAN